MVEHENKPLVPDVVEHENTPLVSESGDKESESSEFWATLAQWDCLKMPNQANLHPHPHQTQSY